MVLFSRPKKVCEMKHAHELQPCVLLKCTPITAKNHSHALDETPGGADGRNEAGRREKKKRFWRSFLHIFRRRARKYELAKAEKLNQNQISLQHIPIVEIHNHQKPPTSEVLPIVEELLEQDVPQPQDVHTPVHLIEEDLQEAPVFEVLITAEEQLEQDIPQLQDVNAPFKIHDPGEPPVSEVLPAVEELLEQDVQQP
ncbi:hypothetical protein Q8A67_017160 [Cirrhinus molitorella]|uniref:Uncharacterized protein n=1 Tax=Cirrhinus molitorella TaxID=172907 RepID=A0AA88TGS4_9TELE|nr:hypothetical protein Q8A67_017160 [Cirrhinus molitorella]